MKISNYDEFEYDYSTYWKNRNYEHFTEVIALKKLLKDIKGDWFLDIGGSYGRHLPMYYNKFSHPVITDYSLNTLINNKFRIWEKHPNALLVASNAYFLPFRENVFNASLMMRVLHHIENPDTYFSELTRVLAPGATHIQEFANKVHIKARIKHSLKGDFSFFTEKPFQQPTQNQFEGSNGVESVFLNFHPRDIQNRLTKLGFLVQEKLGISYFRIEILKKLVPIKLMLFLETVAQTLIGKSNAAPSILFKSKLSKEGNVSKFENLEDILICPKCKSELNFKKEECICSECKSRFEKVAGIWDFRVQ